LMIGKAGSGSWWIYL